jgi:hypothetical protein
VRSHEPDAMIISPVRAAARQVGLWVSLLFVTALLTMLFSILGTVSVSAVVGMAMGASRRWKWNLIPISIIFPMVGLMLGQAAKADLTIQQRLSMAALCFGLFWATYLLTLVLLRLEKNNTAQSVDPLSKGDLRSAVNSTVIAGAQSTPKPLLHLDDLQGTWLCEAICPNGEFQKRTINISENQFVLSTVNSTGGLEKIAQGEIEVNGSEHARVIQVLVDTKARA